MYIQIDRSYFALRPIAAELWPVKSDGLVEPLTGKSKGKNR